MRNPFKRKGFRYPYGIPRVGVSGDTWTVLVQGRLHTYSVPGFELLSVYPDPWDFPAEPGDRIMEP